MLISLLAKSVYAFDLIFIFDTRKWKSWYSIELEIRASFVSVFIAWNIAAYTIVKLLIFSILLDDIGHLLTWRTQLNLDV